MPKFVGIVPRRYASLVTDSLSVQLGLDEAGVKLVEGLAGAHGQRGRDPGRLPGTPAPAAPTQRLVTGGLYRYVRNPMYLAVLAVITGQALMLSRPSC